EPAPLSAASRARARLPSRSNLLRQLQESSWSLQLAFGTSLGDSSARQVRDGPGHQNSLLRDVDRVDGEEVLRRRRLEAGDELLAGNAEHFHGQTARVGAGELNRAADLLSRGGLQPREEPGVLLVAGGLVGRDLLAPV